MKRTNLIYLILLLLTCIFSTTSCKDKSSDPTPDEPTPTETPLFTEGQIVNSVIYENDVIKEEMIDSVVNLGSNELQALFYVNQKHTLNGLPVAIGNHYSNVFRSLSRSDLNNFIVKWGKVMGMIIDNKDTSAVSVKKKRMAFFLLQAFLRENNIDLPLLISLSTTPSDLGFAKRWIDAAAELTASGVKLDYAITPNGIFRYLETSGRKISELTGAVEAAGMTEKDFLQTLYQNGATLANSLNMVKSPDQVGAIALVFFGVRIFTTLTIEFIKSEPVVNLEDNYTSYLNNADTNVMNYISRKDTISPTYKVAYCSLATAEFNIEAYYDAYNITLPGQYINRIGMIVTAAHCGWGMHLNGETVFSVGQNSGTSSVPISYATGYVHINYGDCCASNRYANLNFSVYGNTGYVKTSWNPGKK